MNLFAVDKDPGRAARALCDQHVVRMTLETAQILCTVSWTLGTRAPYRPTHARHPCVVWAGARRSNWEWVVRHGMALAAEFERRYGRPHRSAEVIAWAKAEGARPDGAGRRQPFPQVMPEALRGPDAIAAYRRFYCEKKALFARWRAPAKPPAWFSPKAVGLEARVAWALRAVPAGETISYAKLALFAGIPGGARAVSKALGLTRGLPWWRVVRSDGTLADQVREEQARRLRKEGIVIRGRGIVPH